MDNPMQARKNPVGKAIRSGGRFAGHVVAMVLGVVLMVAGLGMGVSMVLLPVGLPIGLVGLLLLLWGVSTQLRNQGEGS